MKAASEMQDRLPWWLFGAPYILLLLGQAANISWSLPRTGIAPPQKGFSHLGTMIDLAEDISILITGFVLVLSRSPERWAQDCVC